MTKIAKFAWVAAAAAAAGFGLVGLVLYSSKSGAGRDDASRDDASRDPNCDMGTSLEDRVYKGVPFQVAHFSDWYNGTGWRFRFPKGVAGFARGSTSWAGLVDSKELAVGSAQMTVDSVA